MSVLADSSGSRDHVVTRRITRSNVTVTTHESFASTPTPSIEDPVQNLNELRRLFNKIYKKWSRSEPVDEDDMASITSQYVSEENFLKLTESRELAKFIALIDYHIRFEELPLAPHGEIISYMSDFLSGVFQTTNPANVLFGASDNNIRLYAGTIKRPDASYRIRPRALPNPHPPWMRFLANGAPYPNVVVEVEVNHERPKKLREDCHRYFSNTTSVCRWIGIKVWVAGRKFWVGWGERSPTGNRAIIHTNMRFPPHHHPINTPVNLIYRVPMQTVYGNGIPIPPNSPATLCDQIGSIIQEFL